VFRLAWIMQWSCRKRQLARDGGHRGRELGVSFNGLRRRLRGRASVRGTFHEVQFVPKFTPSPFFALRLRSASGWTASVTAQ
jgi:hypothetical protein